MPIAADDMPTVVAIGVLAYVGETLLHELGGHGSMCVATGGIINAIAPLSMQCSVITPAMVAAGPVANLAGATLFSGLMFIANWSPALATWLWLSAAFNGLVAFGYLCVGGLTGFGDWGVLANLTSTPLIWRVCEIVVGVAGIIVFRLILTFLYKRISGSNTVSPSRMARRTIIPAGAAGLIALSADIVGGRFGVLSLLFPVGCTFGVGLALWGLPVNGRSAPSPWLPSKPIEISRTTVVIGAIVSTAFVGLVGPGYTIHWGSVR